MGLGVGFGTVVEIIVDALVVSGGLSLSFTIRSKSSDVGKVFGSTKRSRLNPTVL